MKLFASFVIFVALATYSEALECYKCYDRGCKNIDKNTNTETCPINMKVCVSLIRQERQVGGKVFPTPERKCAKSCEDELKRSGREDCKSCTTDECNNEEIGKKK